MFNVNDFRFYSKFFNCRSRCRFKSSRFTEDKTSKRRFALIIAFAELNSNIFIDC